MRIAVIEDNKGLAQGIAYQMQDAGHSVDIHHNGAEAAAHLRSDSPDLIILDINLPDLDGLSLLRDLRQRGGEIPVLLLTARGETQDRVQGLDAGADDYLVKPFEMQELEARVRALLRRRKDRLTTVRSIGALSFDATERQIFDGEERLQIPRREVALFEALLDADSRLTSKAQLMEHLYGIGADVEDTVIEVHISRLRKRLTGRGVAIRTVRGLGYLMEADT